VLAILQPQLVGPADTPGERCHLLPLFFFTLSLCSVQRTRPPLLVVLFIILSRDLRLRLHFTPPSSFALLCRNARTPSYPHLICADQTLPGYIPCDRLARTLSFRDPDRVPRHIYPSRRKRSRPRHISRFARRAGWHEAEISYTNRDISFAGQRHQLPRSKIP